nr:retrotransposon protein, putative, Ty1-copia subclass [Tanacetum cinerariifolium]
TLEKELSSVLIRVAKEEKLSLGARNSGIFTIELNTFLNRSWIYDTSYGTHICNTMQRLRASSKLKPGALSLYVGNGQREAIEAIGIFYLCLTSGLEIVLDNCHYAPSITRGVISVSRLYEDGFINRFVNNTIQVSRNNMVYFSAIPRDGIFEIDLSNSYTNDSSMSTRTSHPTDCMCLYIDDEEHELGDLGKLANYKTALLDPESDKWLNAMNMAILKLLGIDYEETFSHVAQIRAIRILIAIAAFYDYEIWQMNVKTSFLNDISPKRFTWSNLKNTTSQFQQNLGDLHWTAIKNILKYLKNTKDMFIIYEGDIKRELKVSCYTDVGYLTDADNIKSQTGYVFVLNGGAVDWKSAKQSIFATSSAEAKYIAAFDAS